MITRPTRRSHRTESTCVDGGAADHVGPADRRLELDRVDPARLVLRRGDDPAGARDDVVAGTARLGTGPVDRDRVELSLYAKSTPGPPLETEPARLQDEDVLIPVM